MWLWIYSICSGAFLGLAFLKFPNPPILEHMAVPPSNGWEWALVSWPVGCAYPFVTLLALAGLPLMRWPTGLKWQLGLLPCAWLAWLWFSAQYSIVPGLSRLTCVHFTVGIVCFYLGMLVVGRLKDPNSMLVGMLGCFALVLLSGWQQHFGGLEASRNYFKLYVLPTQPNVDPDMLKRMESNRIFATLFYPNSLAGLLLLVTPAMVGFVADAKLRLSKGARGLLVGLLLLGALGCMVWSGSKAGWLLTLGGGVLVFCRLPIQKRLKLGVVVGLVVLGGIGFIAKYHGFFQKGATSVVARFEYWKAAADNASAHPGVGSGPGSFAKVFERVRPPEAEMARLVHNDYLQQFSDSGLMGGVLFLGLVGWVVWRAWREQGNQRWTVLGIAVGLTTFAAQSFLEFGFYVPATSWCWFALAGWLVAQGGLKVDNKPTST
jgi:hypothetical protein